MNMRIMTSLTILLFTVSGSEGASDIAAKVKSPASGAQVSRGIPEAVRKMSETIDIETPGLHGSLKEVLTLLGDKYGFPPLIVHPEAFKEENPEAASIYDAAINVPSLKRLTRAKILSMILRQVVPPNATFLERPGYVDITTFEHASPERQLIQASFTDKTLAEILNDLSDMTGIGTILDVRVAEKGRTRMTARFRQEISLVDAVRLLADMADLKLVVVSNLLYVTSRSNTAAFPPAQVQKVKRVE